MTTVVRGPEKRPRRGQEVSQDGFRQVISSKKEKREKRVKGKKSAITTHKAAKDE